jgi:hypothetical protein
MLGLNSSGPAVELNSNWRVTGAAWPVQGAIESPMTMTEPTAAIIVANLKDISGPSAAVAAFR